MSLQLIKRLMFVLAAFAILNGAMASPLRAVAAQTGVIAAMASDDCLAMKMGPQCLVEKLGPCKMAASDCAKMLMCCDILPGMTVHSIASAEASGYSAISYDETPAALRGRMAEPALFPPRTA